MSSCADVLNVHIVHRPQPKWCTLFHTVQSALLAVANRHRSHIASSQLLRLNQTSTRRQKVVRRRRLEENVWPA